MGWVFGPSQITVYLAIVEWNWTISSNVSYWCNSWLIFASWWIKFCDCGFWLCLAILDGHDSLCGCLIWGNFSPWRGWWSFSSKHFYGGFDSFWKYWWFSFSFWTITSMIKLSISSFSFQKKSFSQRFKLFFWYSMKWLFCSFWSKSWYFSSTIFG